MIICGASSYSREWDYEKIRSVADNVGAFVLADIEGINLEKKKEPGCQKIQNPPQQMRKQP